jgi:hypothetical protein
MSEYLAPGITVTTESPDGTPTVGIDAPNIRDRSAIYGYLEEKSMQQVRAPYPLFRPSDTREPRF